MQSNAIIPPTDFNNFFAKEPTSVKVPVQPSLPNAINSGESLNNIYRFSSKNTIEKPISIIGLDNHVLATRGNIMTVAGQAKAGKSGFVSATLAGTLAMSGDIIDTLGLTIARNKNEKAVIHIDSEQSLYDHHRGMMQVLKRVSRSKEPDWFHSFNFQLVPIKSRKASLEKLCADLANEHNGLHLIVIDGGADFVLDTNDAKESNEMVQFLTELATEFECPIVVVLHFNPGTEKGRGHFGSQLERKSETIISISKDPKSEVSTIEGKFLRNSGNMPKIEFVYCQDKGYHVYCGIKFKTTAEDKKLEKLEKLCNSIFYERGLSLSYTELYTRIMSQLKIKERAAKEYISSLVLQNLIKNEDGKYEQVLDEK